MSECKACGSDCACDHVHCDELLAERARLSKAEGLLREAMALDRGAAHRYWLQEWRNIMEAAAAFLRGEKGDE